MRISDWSSDVCSSDLTGGYRPHESPLSIPIPLILLSVGAVAAGYTFQNYFIAPDAGETFWKGALYHSEHLMHAMHEVPVWVKLGPTRSEEHTSELQSLIRISYAVFCLKKKKKHIQSNIIFKDTTQ